MINDILKDLKPQVYCELTENIIPFWRTQVIDYQNGGFIGRMSNDLVADKRAAKGLILNARLLWSYSAIYHFTEDDSYLSLARRAYDYLCSYFIDPKFGGAYWLVDFAGAGIDARKKTYGQAFLIYALVEYFHQTGDKGSLDQAITIFELVEKHAADQHNKGYIEAFERNWAPAADLRLSAIDMNEKKSMNTHLHVLEAYTHLYRFWKNRTLEQKLHELLQIFINKIIDPQSYHFRLFFDETWNSKSTRVSFGHDIEGSWLLCEAADVLGNDSIRQQVRGLALKMADSVLAEGVDKDGGVMYEGDGNEIIDSDKHWWPQAEAVVGFINAYQLSRDEKYPQVAAAVWSFIEHCIIDKVHGEWFWRVSQKRKPYMDEPKVSEWKSAYHNSRACLEILNRIDQINQEER